MNVSLTELQSVSAIVDKTYSTAITLTESNAVPFESIRIVAPFITLPYGVTINARGGGGAGGAGGGGGGGGHEAQYSGTAGTGGNGGSGPGAQAGNNGNSGNEENRNPYGVEGGNGGNGGSPEAIGTAYGSGASTPVKTDDLVYRGVGGSGGSGGKGGYSRHEGSFGGGGGGGGGGAGYTGGGKVELIAYGKLTIQGNIDTRSKGGSGSAPGGNSPGLSNNSGANGGNGASVGGASSGGAGGYATGFKTWTGEERYDPQGNHNPENTNPYHSISEGPFRAASGSSGGTGFGGGILLDSRGLNNITGNIWGYAVKIRGSKLTDNGAYSVSYKVILDPLPNSNGAVVLWL